jgi:hypothetical protein
MESHQAWGETMSTLKSTRRVALGALAAVP